MFRSHLPRHGSLSQSPCLALAFLLLLVLSLLHDAWLATTPGWVTRLLSAVSSLWRQTDPHHVRHGGTRRKMYRGKWLLQAASTPVRHEACSLACGSCTSAEPSEVQARPAG